jgi:hypothetical protein
MNKEERIDIHLSLTPEEFSMLNKAVDPSTLSEDATDLSLKFVQSLAKRYPVRTVPSRRIQRDHSGQALFGQSG